MDRDVRGLTYARRLSVCWAADIGGLMQQLASAFRSIQSQAELTAFVTQHGLARGERTGQSTYYSGAIGATRVEVKERWWDPSSVYSIQQDEHEATLVVDGQEAATIRFTGGS